MDYEKLSKAIKSELEILGDSFSSFQKSSPFHCPPQCGKCCYKPDIMCSPYELLPLALNLIERNLAEIYLSLARENKNDVCILLNKINPNEGLGNCTEYEFRPLVCRAFGVSARKNKLNEVDLSICKKLKELFPDLAFKYENAPFISDSYLRLEVLDPVFFEPQTNINSALTIILEKVLLWKSYQKLD